MVCDHFGPGDPRNSWNLPGPWFDAMYPGECTRGGETFEEGEEIRADGDGGYECRACVTEEDEDLISGFEDFDPFS